MGRLVLDRVVDRTEKLAVRPATSPLSPRAEAELVESFLAPPPARGGDLKALLARLDEAADCALETAGPGHLAYIPGSGLYSAALAEFYNRAVNRYGGLASVALAALEESVIRWMAREVCSLPEGSGGLLTSGGSIATFSATVAARHDRLGEDLADGTVYTTAFAHHSVAKTARLAGIRTAHIRTVPHTPDLRMDPEAAAAMIRADRDAGLRPFLLVATAGTTDTGPVDPLPQLADVVRHEDVCFHIDAAYGGFFRLTARGAERLAGIEEADSITLDPHKTLFMPFGTGALVVRDIAALHAAHNGTGSYLQDMGTAGSVPDSGHLGPEVTHEIRGLRAWLPLHLHGVDAFREALDEKLDLAEHVHDTLSGVAELEVLQRPDLSTVILRVRPADGSRAAAERADEASRRLLERINGHRPIVLSSTVVDGRYTLRLCVVSHRTHYDRIAGALKIITAEAERRTPA
ncbi:pyridoxal phosphate-dependent decarboxylase family protein [Streptomyces sp. WI04-05B]|uniref:pyridoxal phosphate-dependent decarboxylase family protein n=1 Tax=Streptomyces TaxID=1883 RepID=UPI0029A0B88D|nr:MULTISPECIES: aminotransferase class V-fold PLP-dependent enzyme [unclassified Streptomyces]MDX2546833.1 aminotransferase class V-fold PLP-dependent enzyme [Streptomyces sp. WI04-05B]MDX2589629.1 aminotransferase class V-fold PLP-dependent enzyme [Streptomyces sp. WI04-05A]